MEQQQPKRDRQWESEWKQLQESHHVQDAGLYSFVWDSSSESLTARMEIKGEDVTCHDIPFRVDDDRTSLHSSQFGKLILLPENANVSVVSSSLSETGLNNTSRWKLQWIRSADALPVKCIACTTCRRTFATLRAVQTHVLQFHPDTSNIIFQQPLRVMYDDDALAIIDKPQGMTVQGDKETLWKSDLLLPLASKESSNPDIFRKPRPVHRLDCATGGLLVVAKTRTAEVKLRDAFATRQCKKRYRALVWGECNNAGVCEEPIKGRYSKTEYKPLQVIRLCQQQGKEFASLPDTCVTLLDLWPETGRKHQLRKHLQGMKHSIVGDLRYGGGRPQPGPYGSKLCLWAMEISFSHPVSGETVTCQLENPDWLHYLVELAQDKTVEKV